MYKMDILKHNKKSKLKGGFSLTELCVVLMMVAILSTMIVSFTTLVSGYAKNNRNEYEFLEQCTELKEELTLWVSQNDGVDVIFTIENNRLKVNGETFTYKYSQIKEIEYSAKGNLLKCTIIGMNDEDQIFVLYLRCGVIGGTGNE